MPRDGPFFAIPHGNDHTAPEESSVPDLFDPIQLRSVTIRNRVGVSPMCMYSSVDGHATDWHLVHLGARAVGGAGLVILEATAVEPRGRITPDDAGLWADSQIAPLRRINAFLKEYGATPAVQLAHAGRKAGTPSPWKRTYPGMLKIEDGGWQNVGPSPIAFTPAHREPAELSLEEVGEVQDAFVAATRRAAEAGFELVELHAAHGYLAHSFLSPFSNQRTDQYGGSRENRMRFVLETAARMRAEFPKHLPVAVRISVDDWAEGGWMIDDTIVLARALKDAGIDLIDCSSGGSTMDAKIPYGPSFQVPFAERIRREAGIATAAVGAITAPEQAQDIVSTGRADMVLLAKELLRDPYWPAHAAKKLGQAEKLKLPPQYHAFIG
ncbi:MAG: NADH:flavin oxidoreductase/NADH oxidase [Candidatus Sumerlaeia bacterium]|nr:NADH:flavin oxidoreductase/NADH oxidase [Candidatus Sumerlaeia bacterium]